MINGEDGHLENKTEERQEARAITKVIDSGQKNKQNVNSQIYGISFGTDYVCIAKLDQNGNPEVIQNFEDGTYTLASAVYFEEDSENILCGESAKEYMEISPNRLIQFFKRDMGRTYSIDGKEYTSIEILALILKKLKQMAEVQGELVNDIVLTVPNYWTSKEIQAITNSVEMAGMNVKNVIGETNAAVISYIYKEENVNQNVLVFDLGGSTLDVSVARIECESDKKIRRISIIQCDGDEQLGGNNWDDVLYNILLDKYCTEVGMELDNLDFDTRQSIRSKVDKTKKMLSYNNIVKVRVRSEAGPICINVTRDEFEECTRHLLIRAVDVMERLLYEVGDICIDKVLLVGGATQMPMVKEAIESRFPGRVMIEEPDRAVAKGAALFAANNVASEYGTVINFSEIDKS